MLLTLLFRRMVESPSTGVGIAGKDLLTAFSKLLYLGFRGLSNQWKNKSKVLQAIWEIFLYKSNFNYNSKIFSYKFAFIPFSSCLKNEISESNFKGAFSGLRQFLAAEIPLKMMKTVLYFTWKAFLILKIFKFLSWLFGHVAKPLDKKEKVSFKFHDLTVLLTSNCNTHIAKYLKR